MEFKKINDTKFQCLLFEEDLEENNISLDDFFRNDTEKIHSLLEVIMAEAEKSIGVILNGGVMSLQLAPQPNRTLLLTISTGNDEFGSILKQAGEKMSQAVADNRKFKEQTGNVIKKDTKEAGSQVKLSPDGSKKDEKEPMALDDEGNYVGTQSAICRFNSIEDLEQFCIRCPKTWGIRNMLYKNNVDNSLYLVLERARCTTARFEQFINEMIEYGEFTAYKMDKIAYMQEHYELFIAENAINMIKKYCNA